jgi:hypothetical protein
MKKNTPAPYIILSLSFLLFLATTFNTSCSKSDRVPETDTVITPPIDTPVIKNTPSYVKRIEVDYIQSNPTVTRRQTDYTFYYDTQYRVIKVGIKNYSSIAFDTATTLLSYIGNALKPNQIIAPNIQNSSSGSVSYDTTYFTYDAFKRIIGDSTTQLTFNQASKSYIRNPAYRIYTYPTDTKTYTKWFAHVDASDPIALVREDTLDHTIDSQITNLKAQMYYTAQYKLNYALAPYFKYSNFVNPLSNLNISGTIVSLIYTGTGSEVLGNRYHKAVNNSNILPFYLDFYSSKIPVMLSIGGFTSNDFLIAAHYDSFMIEAIPWSQKGTYPSKITVGASSSLEDVVVYRYYY